MGRFKVSATGTGTAMAGLGKLSKEEELQVYPNVEELSVSLAAHVANVAASAVEARGVFSVVLSGGSLIKTLRSVIGVMLESWNSKWAHGL